MAVRVPSPDEIGDIAAGFSITLSDTDTASYSALIKSLLLSYERLDALTEPKPRISPKGLLFITLFNSILGQIKPTAGWIHFRRNPDFLST